ncbi:hypothetical protein INT48_006344 [Thamnidium elegans]|uniref:Uncharacterized protein n=1 Tax=Thamnidium elegans TaxID=101142 RepID=A0A8H7SKM1_9FUNG|nr:hypothetical protein INT48_006344 [Thamnidium elegans]
MKERLDRIKRMAGIPADEELEFATPIQAEYSNIRREEQGTDALNPVGKEEHVEEVSSFQENTSATPDLQSEQPVLSDTLKQHTRPRVERRPSRPLSNLVDNTESKLERDVPFVFNLDFVPSPISEFNDDDAPLSDYVPSPISDINDHIEIRSMVSGEYIPEDEAEPNADQISLGVGSISSLSISISSLERMAELLRNCRKADSEAERLNNTVENWINRNILAEAETVEIDIPRVVNTEEQEEEEDRWEFLGFDDFDREGFAHFFFDLPRATLSRVLELREKMDLMKQAFRKLTSYTYISLFNQQVLLGDMSPESVNILEEIQMAYKKMAAQYIHYQTKFEEFELGFTILGAIKFVNSYKPQLRLLFNELRPGSELDPLAFDCIYETMCEGSQVAANLKLTWEKYVKSSSAFKNVQETYQDSIDNIEQEFLLIVNDFHELCGAYFASSGTEEAQRG